MTGGNPSYPSFTVAGRRLESEKRSRPRAEVRTFRPGQGTTTGQAVDDRDQRKLFGEVFLPHLVQAYEGLKQRNAAKPSPARAVSIQEARQRLVQLYDAWGKPEQAAALRATVSP